MEVPPVYFTQGEIYIPSEVEMTTVFNFTIFQRDQLLAIVELTKPVIRNSMELKIVPKGPDTKNIIKYEYKMSKGTSYKKYYKVDIQKVKKGPVNRKNRGSKGTSY